jgi:F-type H+-transporting ATPase subunit alpha
MSETVQDTIVEKLKREIEQHEPETAVERVGRVVSSGDGIAEVDGLTDASMGEMVVFDNSEGQSLEEAINSPTAVYGFLLNLEEETARVVILGDAHRVEEGMLVRGLGNVLSLNVSDDMIGRVVNPLGEPLDDHGQIAQDREMVIDRSAYGVIDRSEVDTPLHTGIKAIDSMIPIGRGQRELIIGDRFTGKTTIAVDTIINQKYEPRDERPVCIYVAIGQKESKTARLVAELERQGAMEYSIVVDASAATSAALQYLAPFAGAAIGEYFMEQGKDALVVFDDLSKHAVAYRQISLLLRRPPGREAYPGDIFYLHSRLLERGAKLSQELGGGSVTALPIIETQEGDVSAYIPTNVISITDGQIFLDTDLFNKGMKPAINVGISVSRVGSSAQTKAMKKVAGSIRLELAQFRELEAFMQFSQDLDAATKQRIESGQRLTEVLNQDKHQPLPFEKQVPVIFAATNGLLADAQIDQVRTVEAKLIEFLDNQHPEIYEQLRAEQKLTDEIDANLRHAVDEFKQTYGNLFELAREQQDDAAATGNAATGSENEI